MVAATFPKRTYPIVGLFTLACVLGLAGPGTIGKRFLSERNTGKEGNVLWVNEAQIKELIGYPSTAFQAGIEGQVALRVLVHPDGYVMDFESDEAAHPLLEMACVEALPYAKFRSLEDQKLEAPAWASLHFDFRGAYGSDN